MLFNNKPKLFIMFKDKSILYIIYDEQKKQMLEHDQIVLDLPVLIEGKLSNEHLIQKRLELLVQEKKLKKSKVHFILPDHFSMIRKEEVPVQLDENEIKDYITLHLNGSIRLPFDSPKVDFQIIEKTDEKQWILLTAYPKDQIKVFQTLFEAVNLQAEVADLSYLSIYRAFKALETNDQQDEHLLMIQWHPFDSSLTVFHNDIPQFSRHTNFPRIAQSWEQNSKGTWEWTGSETELEIVIEDQLNAIDRFLDFYKYSVMNGDKMVTRILLTGDYPKLSYLYERLEERVDIKLGMLELPSDFNQSFAPLYGLLSKKIRTEKDKKKSVKKVPNRKKEEKIEEVKTIND